MTTTIERGITSIVTSTGITLTDIAPQVTVEENHTDEVEITDHPIQYGSPISDHMYKLPSQLRVVYGWSDSPMNLSDLPSTMEASAAITSPTVAYELLLNLQSEACLFSVTTKRRTYDNMALKSINFVTDGKSENSALITLTFRKVFIVNSATAMISTATSLNSSQNASTINLGAQSLSQVGNLS